MRYTVHAMGVHYASFNQELDAQEWAKMRSKKFPDCWWEVRWSHEMMAFKNGHCRHNAQYDLTKD